VGSIPGGDNLFLNEKKTGQLTDEKMCDFADDEGEGHEGQDVAVLAAKPHFLQLDKSLFKTISIIRQIESIITIDIESL
jgi:hypothetical protein